MMNGFLPPPAAPGFAFAALWPSFSRRERRGADFGMDSKVGWIAGVPMSEEPIGDDFLPPPSGPGPVMSDKDHPYNRQPVRRPNRQAADVPCRRSEQSHSSALGEEELRKVNQRVACRRSGLYPRRDAGPSAFPAAPLSVTPVYFLPDSKEVVLIWQEDHMVRHVFLTDKHSAL